MGETLKLKTNVPEVIALQYADGLPTSSQFGGDQVMFTLTDGRKLYVAPIVAQKIANAGIGARQAFSICKREVANGNRRVIQYEIETASCSKHEAVSSSSSTTSNYNQTPSYDGNAARALYAVPAPAPQMVMNGPAAGAAAPPFIPVNGNASAAGFPQDSSAVALLKMAGCGAIDAVLEMESYAHSKGLTDFVFGVDNVQKFAACLFIEMAKKAGRA